jgi:hypothetical protein
MSSNELEFLEWSKLRSTFSAFGPTGARKDIETGISTRMTKNRDKASLIQKKILLHFSNKRLKVTNGRLRRQNC